MPDIYTRVTDAPAPILEGLAAAMLPSWVDMGADALVASGRTDASAAAELKAEARRRVARGEYFGHIAYMSLVARKYRMTATQYSPAGGS